MAAAGCGYDYLAVWSPCGPHHRRGKFPTGTDIACAEGTPILAAADGIVTVANGLDSWGGSYGYYIQIDHGGGLETLYAHCSSICVTPGQQVQAGQVIGYVGHTGRATGSHLHLEVWVDRSRKDAVSFFNVYNEGVKNANRESSIFIMEYPTKKFRRCFAVFQTFFAPLSTPSGRNSKYSIDLMDEVRPVRMYIAFKCGGGTGMA